MTLDPKPARFDALLIGTSSALDTLEPLVATAGGRVFRRLGWNEIDALVCIAPRLVIVADMRDAKNFVPEALDQIEHHVDTHDCPVVALLDADKIDLCTGLHGRGTQLLCEPEDVDIVAALAIAGRVGVALHDILGEGEAARLQRLNEEVARIADVLARLTQRERTTSSANDFQVGFGAAPSEVTIDAAEIRRTIRARRLRDRQFGQGLFEDPAWDMMLDLFAAELERGQVSVSSLCVAAAVAPTTALRWIGRLVDAGLFRREPDPFDRRRAFIALSERASTGMRSYVAAVRAAGLPIA